MASAFIQYSHAFPVIVRRCELVEAASLITRPESRTLKKMGKKAKLLNPADQFRMRGAGARAQLSGAGKGGAARGAARD